MYCFIMVILSVQDSFVWYEEIMWLRILDKFANTKLCENTIIIIFSEK